MESALGGKERVDDLERMAAEVGVQRRYARRRAYRPPSHDEEPELLWRVQDWLQRQIVIGGVDAHAAEAVRRLIGDLECGRFPWEPEPKREPEPGMVLIRVRLERAERDQCYMAARRARVSVEEFIREAVNYASDVS